VDISKDGVILHNVDQTGGATAGIDIDAFGFGPEDLFQYVRLTDICCASGPTAGADITAVGAITTTLLDPIDPIVPDPRSVPALPGLVSYEVTGPGITVALALADESDDVPWAEEAENAILARLSELIIDPNILVGLECRTTRCGVVVEGPDTFGGHTWPVRSGICFKSFSMSKAWRHTAGSALQGAVANPPVTRSQLNFPQGLITH
jgi:hypothetical protein